MSIQLSNVAVFLEIKIIATISSGPRRLLVSALLSPVSSSLATVSALEGASCHRKHSSVGIFWDLCPGRVALLLSCWFSFLCSVCWVCALSFPPEPFVLADRTCCSIASGGVLRRSETFYLFFMYLNNTSEATYLDIYSIWVASDVLFKHMSLRKVSLKMEFIVFFCLHRWLYMICRWGRWKLLVMPCCLVRY